MPSQAASMPLDTSAEIPEPGGVAVAVIAREQPTSSVPDAYSTIVDNSSSAPEAAEVAAPLPGDAAAPPFADEVAAVNGAPCLRRRVGGSWGDTLSFCGPDAAPQERGGRTGAATPSPEDVARVLADEARALAPAPRIEISPQRVGLTGLQSYFWVEAPAPVRAAAGVGGVVVVAEARPVRYVWSFGDRVQLVTDHPGAPWRETDAAGSARTIGHTYETDGARNVVLEQIWEARWRIGDGEWQSLGLFSVTGVRRYPVREVVALLVPR
jgi:hypothetical protein